MKTRLAACVAVALGIFLGAAAGAQGPITVKTSVAETTLNDTAKDLVVNQKSVNDIFQQSRSAMSSDQKILQDQLSAKQKALEAKMRADKKFGPMLEEIDGLVKRLQDTNQKAQSDFNQKIAPMQAKINSEAALMEGLIKVVRQENGLPDDAVYDKDKQTWSIPAKAPEKK